MSMLLWVLSSSSAHTKVRVKLQRFSIAGKRSLHVIAMWNSHAFSKFRKARSKTFTTMTTDDHDDDYDDDDDAPFNAEEWWFRSSVKSVGFLVQNITYCIVRVSQPFTVFEYCKKHCGLLTIIRVQTRQLQPLKPVNNILNTSEIKNTPVKSSALGQMIGSKLRGCF